MSGHADFGRPRRLERSDEAGSPCFGSHRVVSHYHSGGPERAPLHSPRPRGSPGRIRKPGGGRKPLTEHAPELLHALKTLVDPGPRGDPMSPLLWT